MELKKKYVIASTFSPSIYHEVMELDAMIVFFFLFQVLFQESLLQNIE